ncbi:MAG: hypothetical protein WCJ87_08080 [Burkholderiales bacterium]
MTAPTDCDPDSLPLAQEARLLVALLRSSRLALLFGEPGADKSAFLQSSLLPLLQRRVGDQASAPRPRESGVVVPFPDRRSRNSTARRKREVVVLFDDWSATPLHELTARLRLAAQPAEAATRAAPDRLVDCIRGLGDRSDIQFIVLLDRFEEFLRLPAQREGVGDFADELVEALNSPQLPASFLLSLNEDARPALASLSRRVQGFDDFSLKLPGAPAIEPPSMPARSEEMAAMPAAPAAVTDRRASTRQSSEPTAAPIKPPKPLRAPIKTQDVYALIEDTLTRTASDNDCEPFQGSQPGALAPEVVTRPPAPRLRKARQAVSATRREEIKSEPAAAPTAAARRRRSRKPTLIGRCKALFSRWWRPRREAD